MELRRRSTPSLLNAASAAPDGFRYIPECISRSREPGLIECLAKLDWDGRGIIHRMGRMVKRRELDFIRSYGRHTRTVTVGLPLPEFLEPVRTKCAAVTGIRPEDFQQVITALYRPGAGIDWHVDSTKAFGEYICGISLGSPCLIQFRPVGGQTIWSFQLQPRSLFILQGAARWNYQHRIKPVKVIRYSITLRTLIR